MQGVVVRASDDRSRLLLDDGTGPPVEVLVPPTCVTHAHRSTDRREGERPRHHAPGQLRRVRGHPRPRHRLGMVSGDPRPRGRAPPGSQRRARQGGDVERRGHRGVQGPRARERARGGGEFAIVHEKGGGSGVAAMEGGVADDFLVSKREARCSPNPFVQLVRVRYVRLVPSSPIVASSAARHMTLYCGYRSTHEMAHCTGSTTRIAADAPGTTTRSAHPNGRPTTSLTNLAATECNPGRPLRPRMI